MKIMHCIGSTGVGAGHFHTHTGGDIRSNKGPLVKIPRHGGRYEGVFWAGGG
jgi:hypothetical protein